MATLPPILPPRPPLPPQPILPPQPTLPQQPNLPSVPALPAGIQKATDFLGLTHSPGSISDFKSSFRNDLARPSRFDVQIPIPLTLIPYIQTARHLNLRCEATELPGRTLATVDQKIYGPTEKYPYQTTYNDIVMTFMVGGDMKEKLFFDAWLQYINPSSSFDFRYKNDYSSTLKVNQFDVRNKLIYSVDLIDAFPIAINQMDLNWSADGYHKLSVVFAYSRWKNNSIEALGMELLTNGVGQLLGGQGATNEILGNKVGNVLDSASQMFNGSAAGGTLAPVEIRR